MQAVNNKFFQDMVRTLRSKVKIQYTAATWPTPPNAGTSSGLARVGRHHDDGPVRLHDHGRMGVVRERALHFLHRRVRQ